MTDSALPIVTISGSAPMEDVPGATAALQKLAQELCDRLALPARPHIDLAWSSESALTIGSERVAVMPDPAGGPPHTLEQFCRAIHQAGECLVTIDVARRLWQDWCASTSASSPAEFDLFHSMLRESVRFGRRVDRLSEACRRRHGLLDARAADTLREEAFCHEGASRLRILLSREDFATAFEPGGSTPRPLPGDDKNILQMADLLVEGLFYELGILFRVDLAFDESLEVNAFRLEWNDVAPPPILGIPPGTLLVNAAPDVIRQKYNVEVTPAVNPANGNPAALISGHPELQSLCEQAGLTTWGHFSYMILFASAEVRNNAGAFLNKDLVETYLDQLARSFPELVSRVVNRFDLSVLTTTLRALLDEGISIRNLRTIFDALLGAAGTTIADGRKKILFPPKAGFLLPADEWRTPEQLIPGDLLECARIALRRYISHKYTRGRSTLGVLLVESAAEDRVHGWRRTPRSPAEKDEVLDAVREKAAAYTASENLVILTGVETRRPLRQLIRHAFPALPVVSYQELSPEMNIQPVARITF